MIITTNFYRSLNSYITHTNVIKSTDITKRKNLGRLFSYTREAKITLGQRKTALRNGAC